MNNQLTPSLFIFTALECEARALIIYFDLKKDNNYQFFSIYRNKEIVLTITGVGKVAMAGGVAYTLALFPSIALPVLLNIGIAGHKTQQTGVFYSAIKVSDDDSGKTFYPQLVNAAWAETAEIKTVSKPREIYSSEYLYDMEAAAFYETAIKFSSCELIHCLKIISDNEHSSIDKINTKLVTKWISNQVDRIERVINDIKKNKAIIKASELEIFEQIVNKWHFTVSGKIKLKSLLVRWELLSAENWLDKNPEDFINGKKMLAKLEFDVDCLEVHL